MNKRERRRLKRNQELGPLREVVSWDESPLAGLIQTALGQREVLSCGHSVESGPPRTTQTPGKVYRHCPMCKAE